MRLFLFCIYFERVNRSLELFYVAKAGERVEFSGLWNVLVSPFFQLNLKYFLFCFATVSLELPTPCVTGYTKHFSWK